MIPPPLKELSYAQLQVRWQAIIEARFDQFDLCEFLIAIHRDFPAGSLLREVGRVMQEEAVDPEEQRLQPVVVESIENWPMTTRIDGIMPLQIPLASDIALVANWFLREMDTLGFELPQLETVSEVEDDLSLCLFAWLHQRRLKSSFGMMIELTTQCPRSALAVKDELCVMGHLPNGSRITIFYSFLKRSTRLTMPDTSVEHFDALEARRASDGILKLHGLDLPNVEVPRRFL